MSFKIARLHASSVLFPRRLQLASVLLIAVGAVVSRGQQMPAFPGMAGMPGMPGMPGMAQVPGMQPALLSLPPLPPGAEMTFTPLAERPQTRLDAEEALREAQERARELTADLKTIGPMEKLPAVGSAEFIKLRADALAIMKRRFQESHGGLEADAVDVYKSHVTWAPDFSAKPRAIAPADSERARAASYSLAYAITHLDRPRFVLAYAAAIFALDPDSALGAENAASAILASGERLYPTEHDADNLRPYREDAAVVYRYALARSALDGKWTLRSLGILINLGNLYVDMKAPEKARPVLLNAHLFAPDSWDAALALASCYTMQGRPALAKAVLEDPRLSLPAINFAMARGSRNLTETLSATDLSPQSPEAEIEAVMQTLDAQEILTAADFVAELDQSERDRMRHFLDNLPVQGSYRAPEIDGLTQFSTVKSINQPSGIRALGDFGERLGSYAMVLYARMAQQSEDALARLGLGLQLNVDLNDLMAHPEKYRNTQVTGTVTGVDQLKARVAEMKKQALQARRELAAGKTDTLLKMGAATDPMVAIFGLKPHDFANPMDVMIQQYNASMLARKMHTYNAYFFAVNERLRESLTEIFQLHDLKRTSIREHEAAVMKVFQAERAAAARAGQDTNSASWRIREHNIHMRFVPQYNDAAEFAWKQATQTAATTYERKIRPRAERFYYDVFRHIALISDPAVRAKKNREFEQMLHYAVYQGLVNVATAFASYEYTEEWDCHCDVGSLLAQAEHEQKELDRIAEERRARENVEKLRFKAGRIPESSELYKRLDAYGTDLNIPFIPGLGGRISCARTTLTLGADFPGALSPKINYAFTEDAFTGATTHGGALEIGVKLKEGSVSTSATLNVKGSVSIDGKGQVSDYSVTGSSKVKLDVPNATLTLGGEIGYTPTGGLVSDVSAGAKVSLKGQFDTTAEFSVDASARRGSTYAAKAERNYNPFSSMYDKAANDLMDEQGLNTVFPVNTSLKKALWSGSYTQ
jgi:hypothetical protein